MYCMCHQMLADPMGKVSLSWTAKVIHRGQQRHSPLQQYCGQCLAGMAYATYKAVLSDWSHSGASDQDSTCFAAFLIFRWSAPIYHLCQRQSINLILLGTSPERHVVQCMQSKSVLTVYHFNHVLKSTFCRDSRQSYIYQENPFFFKHLPQSLLTCQRAMISAVLELD